MKINEKMQEKTTMNEAVLDRKGNALPRLTDSAEIYSRISDVLGEACIIPGFCGYSFMRQAIIICIRDSRKPVQLCKSVYPEIARDHCSTESSVEHSIRKAVIRCWELSSNEFKEKYFGAFGLIGGRKPTPKEFIVTLAERIERDYVRECQSAVIA